MDLKPLIESSGIEELMFTNEDLESVLDNLSIEQVNELINNSPPLVLSPQLKPNQTLGTEKISIRVPRYILDYFRADAVRSNIGYQTLINIELNEVLRKSKSRNWVA